MCGGDLAKLVGVSYLIGLQRDLLKVSGRQWGGLSAICQEVTAW